jgi:hypothetical protein
VSPLPRRVQIIRAQNHMAVRSGEPAYLFSSTQTYIFRPPPAASAMSSKPPAYGTQDYWESRFKTNTASYDWLEHASLLDSEIAEALATSDDDAPKILHIGCGTSMLSIHLRAFVSDPRQITNIDFSAEAIELGRKLEKDTFNFAWGDDEDHVETDYPEGETKSQLKREVPMMKWTQTSLLELESVVATCELGRYDVIVDKSCCDAIACASWVNIPLPFFLYMDSPASNVSDSPTAGLLMEDDYSIYPLNLLAIHLALVARPGGRWIALSYSRDRWPFCTDESMPESTAAHQALPKELVDHGFPDPDRLWSLIKKEPVLSETIDAGEIHSGHWIYVFERTQVELKVRGT